jgi:hypothetical protein
MQVYSSAPPAPPAPPNLGSALEQPIASSSNVKIEDIAPPAPTEQGPPSLLEQIRLGKSLKKVSTVEKTAKLEKPTSSTLLESLPGSKEETSVNPLTNALSKRI